ncbi:MAG: Glycerophosphoryl diester phosphodiesterase [Phycisphaerales bacterium]|nr:Glycerophosphoryl diester phosphodiesterase [Phycisphaerales bacterium]
MPDEDRRTEEAAPTVAPGLAAAYSLPMASTRPLIVAHRGASFDAPENTLAAFKLAFEQGADAIEGDFHLTADGQVVCSHDATTKRCGDRDLTIATTSLKPLCRVDVGRWKSPRFAGERLPTLAEVLAVVPRGRRIFIELKTGPEIVSFVQAVLRDGPVPASRVTLISFNALTVLACKLAMPKIEANWLTDFRRAKMNAGRMLPTAATILSTLKACRAEGVGFAARPEAMTETLLRRLDENGLSWSAWTVDDLELARTLARRGAKAITTNRPAMLVGHKF